VQEQGVAAGVAARVRRVSQPQATPSKLGTRRASPEPKMSPCMNSMERSPSSWPSASPQRSDRWTFDVPSTATHTTLQVSQGDASGSTAKSRSSSDRPPQHPDQHRPERPVLLAVAEELGQGAGLGVPLGRSRLRRRGRSREHEDVEQFGAESLGSNLTCVAFSQRSDVNLADDAAVASLAARGRITVVR